MKNKILILNWQRSVNDIAEEFAKAYYDEDSWIYTSYWIGNDIGGVLSINDEFWSFDLIKEAVQFDCPKEELFNYYDMYIKSAEEGKKLEYNFVNYINNRTIN
ncbi:MAG: hypothetical protein ACPGDB_05340 [Fusobacterium sp.]